MFESLKLAIEYLKYIKADLADCIDFVEVNKAFFAEVREYHQAVSNRHYSDFEFAYCLFSNSRK